MTVTDASPDLGLAPWMATTLNLVMRARARLRVDTVHDLRTSVRRVRSLVDGLRELDPAPGWEEARALTRTMFQGLGPLRDAQVMADLAQTLADDAGAPSLRAPLRRMMQKHLTAGRATAHHAVRTFDVERWRTLAVELPARAVISGQGHLLFEHLALQRLHEARALHALALRDRSMVALHRLRIGVKKLRYVIENFLPAEHEQVGALLKKLQGLLGEVHDLDVLRALLDDHGRHLPPVGVRRLRARIGLDCAARVEKYRGMALGRPSSWTQLAAALPQGERREDVLRAAVLHWALRHGADQARAERVELATLDVMAALAPAVAPLGEPRARLLARLAALTLGVAHDHHGAHRKKAARRVARLPACTGLPPRDVALVADVVKHQRGPEPAVTPAPGKDDTLARAITGAVRLAVAIDARPALVTVHPDVVTLLVPGFDAAGAAGREVADKRHLLEAVLGRAVVVRAGP